MNPDTNDSRTPSNQVTIKDRVVVRDDSKLSAATMLGALIVVMLLGGALLYAFSGGRDNTATVNARAFERSVPDGTIGQGRSAPSAPKPEQ